MLREFLILVLFGESSRMNFLHKIRHGYNNNMGREGYTLGKINCISIVPVVATQLTQVEGSRDCGSSKYVSSKSMPSRSTLVRALMTILLE